LGDAPSARRDTRPLRPFVRAQLERLLAISPDGRTIAELRAFLVTQRPASRDTIARVLAELQREGLVEPQAEPAWRRRARVRLAVGATTTAARRATRGRTHTLYVPTRRLHDHLQAAARLAPSTPDTREVA
jgi:hypothetical protein